ncbi:glycoside hydrolase family 97 catalytic domain-containing protein [Halomicroarcula sp. GCM10025709]|uniref:glycoside hydrolase family 97 catalytic domain-containing protein n=1 Tax=Haloarcula TaxID=2237 RepID=UPI0024C321EB|nr:glycoside hydrolase family 97 catalytic domain-containing protein [Halomicroarcula sp. YJ-61-S]
MVGEQLEQASDGLSRRGFLGGVSSLLAAAAYSRDVPEDVAAQVTNGNNSDTQTVSSPDGSITVTVDVTSGIPTYSIDYNNTTYITGSRLGFDFQNQATFGLSAGSSNGAAVTVTGAENNSGTEAWDPVWGQYNSVSEDYNLLRVGLEETASPSRSLNLEIKVFNDGLGFRVTFDDDFVGNSDQIVISSENTEFNFAGDYTSWWIENTFVNPRFEQEYSETNLSELPSGTTPIEDSDGISPVGENDRRAGAHTPLTVEADDGTYLSLHEADLDDYATMSLAPDSAGSTDLSAELAPLPDGTKVSTSAPHVTPWRTVQIGATPGDLIESSLIPLLNEPLETQYFPGDGSGGVDTSWMTPRMYIGIWWTMIAGNANWEYKSDTQISNNGNDPAAYIHGARTQRMKRYMRFASEHNVDSVLVEGWNKGWDSYGASANGSTLEMGVADSYPDFSVPEVTDYGLNLSSSVEMTIHNETSGNLYNYEDEINNKGIFSEYENAGIRSIKNGYVNDFGLYDDSNAPDTATTNQHSQVAVDHHRTVIQNAAQYRQTLEIHEGIKPTGERRTYPNVAAREVVLAQEYDGFGALGSGVGRDHHVTLPFTRMLAGPTSYQPGIFDITFNDSTGGQIQTTRAKQLAMYPSYNAGIQMAADRVEAYIDDTFEVGEYLQAQCGTLDGMITADDWRNAFGAHYVPIDPNREASGSRVEFTVKNVSSAGTYDLHLRYASDGTVNAQRVIDNGEGQATVSVNGTTQTITPSFTGGWDQWEVITTQVSLQSGDNTVAIELDYDDSSGFTGDVGGFNVNTVGVTAQGAGAPFPADYTSLTDSQIENENFDYDPDFKYIEDVPAGGWDETRVLDSQIGDYTVTARRKGNEWYVGAMNDDNGRSFEVTLDFLTSETSGWKMEMYTDDVGTNVDTDPTGVRRTTSIVGVGDTVTLSAARGGGTAVRLVPATSSEASNLQSYQQPAQNLSFEIDSSAVVSESIARATGSNATNFISGETVEVVVDGSVQSLENIRLAPNSGSQTIELEQSFSSTGSYSVEIRALDGTTLASKTVSITNPTTVAQFSDPDDASDALGPGSYVNATNYADGSMDIQQFTVKETPSNAIFEFEIGSLNDPYNAETNGTNNFSPQWFFVWLRDPDKSTGSITDAGNLGDPGLNATFESEWHYRVDAYGFGQNAIDNNGQGLTDANGNPVSPTVSSDKSNNTVSLQLPKSALGGTDLFDMEVIAAVHSDDFGALRAINETAGSDQFGGLDPAKAGNAPRLMDMITPPGVDKSDALGYTATEKATLPFTPIYTDRLGDVDRVVTLDDSTGDSYGPAEDSNGQNAFSYPSTDDIKPQDHDIERVDIYEDDSNYTFLVRVPELRNPATFEQNSDYGYGLQHIQIYVSDPNGQTGSIGCRDGVHAFDGRDEIFGQQYHRRIVAHGFDRNIDTNVFEEGGRYPVVEDGFWQVVADADSGVSTRGIPEVDAIEITVPRSTIPSDIRETDIVPMMFSYAGGGTGEIRKVENANAINTDGNPDNDVDPFTFTGAPSSYHHNNILDIVFPDGVSQADILDPTASDIDSDDAFDGYDIPFVALSDKANSIREALAGNGKVTTAHFEEVKQAYETESAVEGTGGLVPDYDDLRSIAREVQN